MLNVSERLREKYPGAMMGILAMENVTNPPVHDDLEDEKHKLERQLRERYSTLKRDELIELPSIRPYVEYYRNFKKTYHTLLQLESVVLMGKSLPRVAALVEAMFIAELKNQLLTAGHDLDAIQGAPTLEIARGDEVYNLLGGKEAVLKENDMFVMDGHGIISSIIYGPDQRTRIVEQTRRVLFTVYAPSGISATLLEQHLSDLEQNVHIIAPQASVLEKQIYS